MTDHIPTLDVEEIRKFLMGRSFLRPHDSMYGRQNFASHMFVTNDVWDAIRDRTGIPETTRRELSLLIFGYLRR
jgi:hypothetical protein